MRWIMLREESSCERNSTLPILELTDDQVLKLLEQLPLQQQQRIGIRVPQPSQRIAPRFGVAAGSIKYMAEDFDAPLPDFDEYIK